MINNKTCFILFIFNILITKKAFVFVNDLKGFIIISIILRNAAMGSRVILRGLV